MLNRQALSVKIYHLFDRKGICMWEKIKSLFSIGSKRAGLKGRYILVVDDSDVERQFYKSTLKRAGYHVLSVSGASEAMMSLENGHPDLIISDLDMPDIDGKELCRRIKNAEMTENIPVIFLTGSAKPGDVVECFDAGGDFYLEKPISAGTLIRQVNNIFNDLEEGSLHSRGMGE